jgi:hypothetical protein
MFHNTQGDSMRYFAAGPQVELRRIADHVFVWALAAVVACGGSGTKETPVKDQQASTAAGTPGEVRPTPPAPFATIERATAAQIASYAQGLEFDTSKVSSGVTHIPAVSRSGVPPTYADAVWSPEIGAAAITDDDLGRGRIIARVRSTGATSPFRAPPGIAYLWVDSAGVAPQKWRSVLLSDAGRITFVGRIYFGTTPFLKTAPTRMSVVADSFPNGRCGTHCCFVLLAEMTMDPLLLDRLTAAVHAP